MEVYAIAIRAALGVQAIISLGIAVLAVVSHGQPRANLVKERLKVRPFSG